jgi:hypothetical protein
MKKLTVILSVLVLSSLCCKDNEVVLPADESPIVLSVSNLAPLPSSEAHYQLWASFYTFNRPEGGDSPMHDSGFVSLGEFNINEDGKVVSPDGDPVSFSIPPDKNPQLLADVIIAVQPIELVNRPLHDEPGPAILGGRFYGTARQAIADLNMGYVDAFGTDFSAVRGGCTITAPTSVPADSNSGVWFYEPGPTPSPSLRNLPALPEGWVYEGWVIDRTLPGPLPFLFISTGRFERPDSADFDGPGPGAGPGQGLNFPGQDFINPVNGLPGRPNLRNPGYFFRVTIEPRELHSSFPFFLTLLSNEPVVIINTTHAPAVTFEMTNRLVFSAPKARLTIKR